MDSMTPRKSLARCLLAWVPQNQGYQCGNPSNKDCRFLGSILGVPIIRTIAFRGPFWGPSFWETTVEEGQLLSHKLDVAFVFQGLADVSCRLNSLRDYIGKHYWEY